MWTAFVIKIGGHEIGDPAFLTELALTVRHFKSPVILVHGGGKEITALSQKLGIAPVFHEGVRVTDAASLSVAEMVLCGMVNKRLVRYLIANGVEALGVSGIDRGLIRARPAQNAAVDMGFTGTVSDVRADLITTSWLEKNITPVIAPICLGDDSALSVNADEVASAVAAAVGAGRVVYLTNVEGVLVGGEVLPSLTPREAQTLIADGTIHGGMIPKVRTALAALEAGVPRAVITNLIGLKSHGGTVVTATN